MSESTWLVIAGIVIVVLIAVVIAMTMRERNTRRLKSRFGAEYDRTVEARDGRKDAEAELQQREKRVKGFDLRPLSADERARFTDQWRHIQSAFVDDPGAALTDADRLVGEVMTARGYPSAGFDQRSADVSVDHANVMESYRSAHQIALRNQQGEAGTEDLRGAMVSYRALFDDLVGSPAESDRKTEELPDERAKATG